MIWEDRSDFWQEVADHPLVAPHLKLANRVPMAAIVEHPSVLPLRSEHGGFLLHRLDPLGHVVELHALYTPEGWGREVTKALKDALTVLFEGVVQVVTVNEVAGSPMSRPPLSFGFRQAGEFQPSAEWGVSFCTWTLTKRAWEQSPARGRMGSKCLLQ